MILKRSSIIFIIIIFVITGFCITVFGAGYDAITYQGRLAAPDGSPVADGYYSMSFSLWNQPGGGDPETNRLWMETYDGESQILVSHGLFTVRLGEKEPFPDGFFRDHKFMWLEVQADTDNDGLDSGDIYSPRVTMSSLPFAFESDHARDANTLAGRPPQDFADASHSHWFANIQGEVSDAQVPNNISIEQATNSINSVYSDWASTASYASDAKVATYSLHAENLAGKVPADFATADHYHWFANIRGEVSDSQVPNNITIEQSTNSINSVYSDWASTASYASDAKVATYSLYSEKLNGFDYTHFATWDHQHYLQDLPGSVTDVQVPNDITVNYASEAGDATLFDGRSPGYFATRNHIHNLEDLPGAVTDSQVPDNITINYAASAGNASTASNSDRLDGRDSTSFADSNHDHNLQDLPGAVTDAQVPDNISITLAQDSENLGGHSDTFYRNASNINEGILAEERIDPAIARVSNISPRQYEAVVAASGGDYTTIQAALADGKSSIFVRDGVYSLTSNIVINRSHVRIIGETRCGVVLDCGGGGSHIAASPTDTSLYSAGTISIPSGFHHVTGSGTAWSSNLQAGDFILLREDWYEINNVDSDTELTLVKTYMGRTISSENYLAGEFLTEITLENLTFTNFCNNDGGAFECYNLLQSCIRNCMVKESIACGVAASSNFGLILDNSHYCRIPGNRFSDLLSSGMSLRSSSHNRIYNNSCVNCLGSGISLDASRANNILSNATNNNQNGIYLNASTDNIISSNIANNNSDGIELNASSGNTVESNMARNCILGISLMNSSEDNVISGNNCSTSVNGIYLSNSNYNALSGNSAFNCTNNGIYLFSTSQTMITANQGRGNAAVGLYLNDDSDENIISGNSFINNGTYGIHISDAACNNNLASNNVVSGNGTAPSYDQGTDTWEKYHNYPRGW